MGASLDKGLLFVRRIVAQSQTGALFRHPKGTEPPSAQMDGNGKTPVNIQVQRCVKVKIGISRQVQRCMKVEIEISRQVQCCVKVEIGISRQVQHCAKVEIGISRQMQRCTFPETKI